MKIAILYGGRSGEHEVSLQSAASISRNLDKSHKITLIGVAKNGSWHLQPDSILADCLEGSEPLKLKTDSPEVLAVPGGGLRAFGPKGSADLPIEMVFPVLHGSFGEDGTIQGLLECAGLAYVGADVFGSALCIDKEKAKELWMAAGLEVVPFLSVNKSDLINPDIIINKAEKAFSWPMFVKPARCGSSVGASKVNSIRDLKPALELALTFDNKALIEPFISAREIECSVLGNYEPRVFPPGELIPTREFYDYEAKYIDPDGAHFVVPAVLSAEEAKKIMDIAITAYKVAGISSMARIDFFIDKNTGKIYLNEANTIPGFTSISMYPKMCQAGGLTYPQLLEELLTLAKERFEEKNNLRYER